MISEPEGLVSKAIPVHLYRRRRVGHEMTTRFVHGAGIGHLSLGLLQLSIIRFAKLYTGRSAESSKRVSSSDMSAQAV